MENTSGQGGSATVPAEIDKWNWGAFLLNWIWGIGNSTFIALLMFIPLINMVMPFVLGVKGSSWAWRNRRWDSIEEFRRVQRNWTRWALIIYAAGLLLLIGIFFAVTASLKSSDAFRLAMEKLQTSQEAMQLLGTPISTGLVTGNMETTGPKGRASLSFPVSGPNGKGTVNMEASKGRGKWEIDTLMLEEDVTGKRIDLNH